MILMMFLARTSGLLGGIMIADKDKIIDVLKYTFNKYGTYQSLKKDAELLFFFIHRPDEEIRQKNIIIYFSSWSPKTVRRHLKRLVEKKIITEQLRLFLPLGVYLSEMEPMYEKLLSDLSWSDNSEKNTNETVSLK